MLGYKKRNPTYATELHQEDMHDWDLVMKGEEPFKINPLQ